MVILGGVERRQRSDFRDDPGTKRPGPVEVGLYLLGRPPLCVVVIKNHRAILSADIVALLSDQQKTELKNLEEKEKAAAKERSAGQTKED